METKAVKTSSFLSKAPLWSLASAVFEYVFDNFRLVRLKVETLYFGSGCGSVGKAVASDTRGPWFESSHR